MEKVARKWQGMVLALVVLISFGIFGRAFATFDTGGTSIVFATSNFWEPVGSKDFISTGGWGTVNIALNPTTDEPYIEYMDWSKGGITVKKFDGAEWKTVGDANFNSDGFEQASLALNPTSNEPYVAYADGSSHGITVRKYNGSQWVLVGSPSFTSSEALSIKLVFNPSTKKPYVAYRNYAGKITVQGYDGSQWVPVGNVNLNANGAYNVSLTFDPGNGQPYVGYSEWSNSGVINGGISVKRLEGSQWVTAGNTNFNPTGTTNVDLAFNPTSKQPYIAYGDWTRGEITVKKLDGTQWTNVGSSNFNSGGAFNVHLAFNQLTGEPYVAYNNSNNSYKLSVKKFDGSQWSIVGNANFSPDQTYQSNIAFNPATNQPYVIGNDGGGITVMKYGDGKPYNINSSKTSYNIGENITVSWTPSISDSKKYKISAYGNDGGFAWFPNLIGSSRNIQLSRAGIYRVFIEPNYGLGNDPASNTVMLTVTNELPGATTVSTTKKTYYENEDVVVKWSAAKYATKYAIYISNNFWDLIFKQPITVEGTSYNTKLPEGSYFVAVRPLNPVGWGSFSNMKAFKVVSNDNPLFPVDLSLLDGWYGLTYPTHQIDPKTGKVWQWQYSAIDIQRANNTAKDIEVRAIQSGKVIQTNPLIIEHDVPLILTSGKVVPKWYSLYGHMNNPVSIGRIEKGSRVGNIGFFNSYHLHFSIFGKLSCINNDCSKSDPIYSTSNRISPFWLSGDYQNKGLYADDANPATPDNDGSEPNLYYNRIFNVNDSFYTK